MPRVGDGGTGDFGGENKGRREGEGKVEMGFKEDNGAATDSSSVSPLASQITISMGGGSPRGREGKKNFAPGVKI